MIDYSELKSLALTYGQLRNLEDGLTTQRRGELFNKLVAEVFRAYGIDARWSTRRDLGEIDVHFTVGGNRYILEAKWHADHVSQDAVAKIRDRISESMLGTRGIILSMSGFTEEAVTSTRRGKQLALVLIDASHFESMLTGVISPAELIESLVDHASFLGEPSISIDALVRDESPTEAEQSVYLGGCEECPRSFVNEIYDADITGSKIVATQKSTSAHGIAVRKNGNLVLTTASGLVEINESQASINWLLKARRCSNSAAECSDRSVGVVRNSGVIAVDPVAGVRIIGGGLAGNARVFNGPSGELWAIENGDADAGMPVTLTRFGQHVGDETRFPLDSSVASPGHGVAAAASNDEIFVIGNGKISKMSFVNGRISDIATKHHSLSNPGGLAILDGGRLIGVGSDVVLNEFSSETLVETPLISLHLGGSNDVVVRDSGIVVTAPCVHGGPSIAHRVVIEITR